MAYRLECPACGSGYVVLGKEDERLCRKCGYRREMQAFEKIVTLEEAKEQIEAGKIVVLSIEERKKIVERG